MPRHAPGPANPSREPETLQLSVEPMRTWVNDGRGGRVRPLICVLVAERSLLCLGMDLARDDEPPFEVAGRVLLKTLKAAGNPAGVRLQVKDPELATVLRRRVELAEVRFEVVDRLEAAEQLLARLERDMFPSKVASPLGRPGVSVERLRAFAEGCAAFHAARPWRELHDDDVVVVESPPPPDGMAAASVLGAGGQVIGLGFYKDAKAYDRMRAGADQGWVPSKAPRWAMMFHAPDELPPEDAGLWEDNGLPVAPDESVPLLVCYRGKTGAGRPDGPTMTFVEGLCRAIAATTGAELDTGRWEKSVVTFDGPVTYRLSIPHLLETEAPKDPLRFGPAALERAMRQIQRAIEQSGARTEEEANRVLKAKGSEPFQDAPDPDATPAERAAELCFQAQGQRSRRELQLLREALRIDPDCADAYVMLARRHSEPTEAEQLYRRGMDAGRRALGDEVFSVPGYPFWLATESRPFMRAMAGLAQSLELQGRLKEAADVQAEMLRLNPGDNQGIRDPHVAVLIALGRLDRARAILESEEYRDDDSAMWNFAGALVAFKQGREDDAARLLKAGVKGNRFVAPMILNPDLMPPGSFPTWSPGDESEAVMVAELLGDAWASDAAALGWLESASRPAPRKRPVKRNDRKPKGRKPKK